MSSGRDEWMSNWTDEDKERNLSGVSGKQYEQLEFDFSFLSDSDKVLQQKQDKAKRDAWRIKHDATNYVYQAKAVITMVMDNMGSSVGSATDDQEFALWGASELLQKAVDVLES